MSPLSPLIASQVPMSCLGFTELVEKFGVQAMQFSVFTTSLGKSTVVPTHVVTTEVLQLFSKHFGTTADPSGFTMEISHSQSYHNSWDVLLV